MEMINFILSQCVSYLVGILSGLSTNYIDDKLKSHSVRKSGLDINFKYKDLELKIKSIKRK